MAVALEALGRHTEADTCWADALAAGDHGSFVRVYADGSPMRQRMLERAAGAGPAGAHARRVLAACGPATMEAADPALTGRQLDVLRMVERGLSNKAIARELGLSISTVKTHLRALYTRLNAESRTHALARARAYGWLARPDRSGDERSGR
jgi:DNA-binding NarL/FixJ family response regulator